MAEGVRSVRIDQENSHPGVRRLRPGLNPDDVKRQVQGYASATSVNVGESIDFHVSVALEDEAELVVEIYRAGWYGGDGSRLVDTSPTLTGRLQSPPRLDPETGMITCDWPVAWTLTVGEDWVSGLYLAVFVVGEWRGATPFVVRDDASDAALCVVLPFATWQAYNQWPGDGRMGKSLYYGFPPTADDEEPIFKTHPPTRAMKVSFDRPYERAGIPSQAEYDFNTIGFLEREGYDVTYTDSLALHRGLVDPTRFAGLILSGHDEYWSTEMRAVAERGVAAGTGLAVFGANAIYWHVRFERDERVMVCYKGDPDPEAGPGQATTKWRNGGAGPGRPEQALLGVQYMAVVPDPVPLVISNASHWVWAGCGVRDGDTVDRLVAIEADNHRPNGPKPNGPLTLLATSPYTMASGKETVQNTSVYTARSGAIVFVAGTFYWPYGLGKDGYVDKRIQLATNNLLRRILDAAEQRRGSVGARLKGLLRRLVP